MKPFIVFLPGLFDTSLLKCGEPVWPIKTSKKVKLAINGFIDRLKPQNKTSELPPSIKEMVTRLADKNLTVGFTSNNYSNLISLIKELCNDNWYMFNYDWRSSLNETINKFAAEFDKLDVEDRDVYFIGHSAGGIIGYKYLATPSFNTENSNFSKVKKMIAIGSPFQGCIKPLLSILGLMSHSILDANEVQEIINMGFMKSIYELCPYNMLDLFYHKDTRGKLTVPEVVSILERNGFSSEGLTSFSTFKKEMTKLQPNEDVNYLFISGLYNKFCCSSFLVDIESGEIECVYEYGSGDGTVLKDETVLNISNSNVPLRKITVSGKHQYLTEIDTVLDIIRDEVNLEIGSNLILSAQVVANEKNEIDFLLFVNKGCLRFPVTDFNASHISFSKKCVSQNITKSITKKSKEPPLFSFKSNEKYGFIRFRDLNITYGDNIKDNNRDHIKEAKIELEKFDSIFF